MQSVIGCASKRHPCLIVVLTRFFALLETRVRLHEPINCFRWQDNLVWVAKSDTEVRGPVTLQKLFPGLPSTVWRSIFARGASINFISQSATWLYDIKTDKIVGPTAIFQNEILQGGPAAELSDGKMVVFPTTESISDGTMVYMLDRLSGQVLSSSFPHKNNYSVPQMLYFQVLPGYPRRISDVFCWLLFHFLTLLNWKYCQVFHHRNTIVFAGKHYGPSGLLS